MVDVIREPERGSEIKDGRPVPPVAAPNGSVADLDERIDKTARSIIEKYRAAFEELAK